MQSPLVISQGKLERNSLGDRVALVTGAGSGIGYECARSLAWLGANVLIMEIDKKAGSEAASLINRELGRSNVEFVHGDVGDTGDIEALSKMVIKGPGRIGIVVNNAAVEPMGAVSEAAIESWDRSYRVNLRGPVLLARAFLPGMLKRHSGVFVCVSSVGGAYMGPYEVLKRAQVELASTIAAECEGTGVIAFTIGPGLVPETKGASLGMPQVARMMGKTVGEFTEMSKAALISAEAAGAGFAAAVALASHFAGMETSSQEALREAGIEWRKNSEVVPESILSNEEGTRGIVLANLIRQALREQLRQWQGLGVFQRGWMLRDFTKRAGLPVEKYIERLSALEARLESASPANRDEANLPLNQLADFFRHMQELTQGFVKDEKVRIEQMELQRSWEAAARELARLVA